MIDDQAVLDLIGLVLQRLDDVDGELFTVEQGISKGCPLSPILGAVYLAALDEALAGYAKPRGLCYARFMDDWVILCKTRGQLRTAVRLMNRVLERLKVTKHPFKTYIGRMKESGFDSRHPAFHPAG